MEVVLLVVVAQLALPVVVEALLEAAEVVLLLVAEAELDQLVVVQVVVAHLLGLDSEVLLQEVVVVLVVQAPYQLEIFDLALLVVA